MENTKQYKPKVNFTDTATIYAVNQIRETSIGKKVCTAKVSLYEGKDKDGNYRPSTWLELEAWEHLAEYLSQFSKGHKVRIAGRLTSRSYNDKNGNLKTVYVVKASDLQYVEKTAAKN
jgi:single-strand DNA-binding protein